MSAIVIGFLGAFFGLGIGIPIALACLRLVGFYDVVTERRCHVYVLFGEVLGVIDEPGLHFLWGKLGPKATIVRIFGDRHVLDLRIDQEYLRSQPLNSEEGAPMGVGIWYEMQISDPVAFLFKNTDPRGSLRANVGSTAVRVLSNLPLADMLETRHTMSANVRSDVSPKAHEWGYRLGSVYIRKVHFRDAGMIHQIEEKVINRLRQVTSSIRQDGVNQVNLISSTAERHAAVEFARASTLRPRVVGEVLSRIGSNPKVAAALFDLLETQRLMNSQGELILLPRGSNTTLQSLVGAK